MTCHYPIVKLPKSYTDISDALPPELPKPLIPCAPVKKPVEKPDSSPIKILFTIILLPLFLLLASSINERLHVLAVIITCICFMIYPFIIPLIWKDSIKYFTQRRKYFNDLKISEDEYKIQLSRHIHFHMKIYEDLLIEHPQKELKSKTPQAIEDYRNKLYSQFFSRSKEVLVHPYNQEIKQGAYEKDVYDILCKSFVNKVYINCTAEAENKQVGRFAPMPDFVIHDSIYNYSIVIELDEPYELNMGTPIHFSDSDKERDEYFLSTNWFVIRFSERQFVKHPDQCCEFISTLINHITKDKSINLYDSNYYFIQEPTWTYEDAVQMELTDFRETYLPRLNYYKNHPIPKFAPTSASKRRIRRENNKASKNQNTFLDKERSSILGNNFDNSHIDLPF